MHPKDAEGIAKSVDPDQTAPLGAVWSGSPLFAQTCLSENLGKLRYNILSIIYSFADYLYILYHNVPKFPDRQV